MNDLFINPIFWPILMIGLLALGFLAGRGLFWQGWRSSRRQQQMRVEDGLKHVFTFRQRGIPVTVESLAGAVELNRKAAGALIDEMERSALVLYGTNGLELTPKGEAIALHVVRAHRLWETHLADRTGVAPTDWHSQAEHREHSFSPDELDTLSASLGHPVYDPHGDPIPSEEGADAPAGFALTEAQPNQTLRILHLEDEPPLVYAQLVAEGLQPGMVLQVLEKSDQFVRFVVEGEERRLAPQLAANVGVRPARRVNGAILGSVHPLTDLRLGESAHVAAVSRACRGPERRRLLDLGILPGAIIEVAMTSPLNDPVAYRVRDTLIALRREQAQMILIERAPDTIAA